MNNTIRMDFQIQKAGMIHIPVTNKHTLEARLNGVKVSFKKVSDDIVSIFIPKGKGELVLKYRLSTPKHFFISLGLMVLLILGFCFLVYTDMTLLP